MPDKIVIYQNDFESSDTTGIRAYGNRGRIDTMKIIPFNGTNVLGNFSSTLLFLNIRDIPSHNAVKIEFDLYIHDKWEGDRIAPGNNSPDFWNMLINDFPVYLCTFSNGSYKQSFPDKYTGSPSTNNARANAWGVAPGICSYANQPDGSTLYRIEYTTSHEGSLEIKFADTPLNLVNTHCRKSWSIDNIRITAITYK